LAKSCLPTVQQHCLCHTTNVRSPHFALYRSIIRRPNRNELRDNNGWVRSMILCTPFVCATVETIWRRNPNIGRWLECLLCRLVDPLARGVLFVILVWYWFRDRDGLVCCLGDFFVVGGGKVNQDFSCLVGSDTGRCTDGDEQ
jgi:hypothetical protein